MLENLQQKGASTPAYHLVNAGLHTPIRYDGSLTNKVLCLTQADALLYSPGYVADLHQSSVASACSMLLSC